MNFFLLVALLKELQEFHQLDLNKIDDKNIDLITVCPLPDDVVVKIGIGVSSVGSEQD